METAGVWWSFIHSARESCREEWSRRDSEMGGEAPQLGIWGGGKSMNKCQIYSRVEKNIIYKRH